MISIQKYMRRKLKKEWKELRPPKMIDGVYQGVLPFDEWYIEQEVEEDE